MSDTNGLPILGTLMTLYLSMHGILNGSLISLNVGTFYSGKTKSDYLFIRPRSFLIITDCKAVLYEKIVSQQQHLITVLQIKPPSKHRETLTHCELSGGDMQLPTITNRNRELS